MRTYGPKYSTRPILWPWLDTEIDGIFPVSYKATSRVKIANRDYAPLKFKAFQRANEFFVKRIA
jgi:hypothetical protein